MRNRWLGLMVAIVALLAGASSLSAQRDERQGRAPAEVKPAPRLPDGKPDLYGVWTVRGDNRIFGVRQGGTGREQAVTPAEEAMKPEVREKYRAQLQAGKLRTIERDNFDPAIRACAPFGTSRIIQQGRPFEVFQIPGRVIFRYEQEHWVRNIWMDGREHPKDLIPTWMGHSTGRWDGDTLVVDTIGFNDLTWLDSPGHPHSESLRLEQRYTRVNQDTMEIQLTVHDPEIYTRPLVSNQLTYRLIPNGEITEWVNCEDRLNMHLEMDVCEITGAWEFEAHCKKRETGQPAPAPRRGY
ncbi:MAG: hypothetical protein ACRD88_18515 [Terriglobia bacterium]